jgi:HPr kinase/phosphorylase
MGESGIGKSEVALELVKRGHRLVADDLVEVRLIGATTLVGRALKINQHYMEIRGLGIIDVKTLFGAGAIKLEQEIQLVAELKMWQMISEEELDRLGLHMQRTTLLDLPVPKVLIAVQPGRNLATVIEVAAMNLRLKYMGLNAAEEFVQQLEAEIARKKARNPRNRWKVSEDGSKIRDHSFGHPNDEWSNDGDRS